MKHVINAQDTDVESAGCSPTSSKGGINSKTGKVMYIRHIYTIFIFHGVLREATPFGYKNRSWAVDDVLRTGASSSVIRQAADRLIYVSNINI